MVQKKKSKSKKSPATSKNISPGFFQKNITSILIAGVALLFIAGIIWLNKGTEPSNPSAPSGEATGKISNRSLDTADDPILGSRDAMVVLHEYSDFQCPACQNLDPVLKELYEKSSGKVAWIYSNFPLVNN